MRIFYLVVLLTVLSACETIGYYGQSVGGQLAVLANRRPITELIHRQDTAKPLRAKLLEVSAIRDYATRQLGLPLSQSFSGYVALQRPYVVWSVVATPKLSLKPKTWCYPIIGCASYRGYFNEQRAQDYALTLKKSGLEVSVAGVSAYSTLGWFADPIYSPILQWPKARIARLIFHELAHEQLYVPGDSAFNEAYASVVAEIGVQRWLLEKAGPQARMQYAQSLQREKVVYGLLQAVSTKLRQVYQADQSKRWKQNKKKGILTGLSQDYLQLQKEDPAGYEGYKHWFQPPPNNAQLASIGTYRRYMPAFEALFELVNGQLAVFYKEAKTLAEQKANERGKRLARLLKTNKNSAK